MTIRVAAVACGIVTGCGFEPAGLPSDASAFGDGAAIDAMANVDADPACSTADSTTVALWTFDAGDLADVTGAHDGVFEGGAAVAGPGRCGNALVFAGDPSRFGLVADSPAWDLPVGSIELWIRIDALPIGQFAGLLSRDANGYGDGHFAVGVDPLGNVMTRIQSADLTQRASCTSVAVVAGQWHHVAVNFGGGLDGEVFVDRVLAPLRLSGSFGTAPCDTPLDDRALAGNDRPWAFGGLNWSDMLPDPPYQIQHPLDGAIDHVHVRAERRDFATR